MILPEDRPDSPSKLPTPPAPQAASPEPLPPPAYEASTSRLEAGPSESQPLHGGAQPLYVLKRHEPAARARKRFVKAFCLAVLLYVVLAGVLGSVAQVGRYKGRARKELEDIVTAQPGPDDGKALHCIKGAHGWAHVDGQVTTTFRLSRFEDVLYLYTRGTQLHGNVVVIQDDRIDEPDVVHVDVTAQNSTRTWLHAVSVCMMERAAGEQGVALFSPKRWRVDHLPELSFEVTVRLPKLPEQDGLLQIARLESVMPNFSHHVGDLAGRVLFRNITLRGANAHMYAESVGAMVADISTSNERISGSYAASQALKLTTSNARINVTATLSHRDADDSEGPALQMKTSNGKIRASVQLETTLPIADSARRSAFRVEAHTANDLLDLDVSSMPAHARLTLDARTTNANARVALPAAYEGRFDVRTSNQVAFFHRREVQDPAGRGRERTIVLHNRWAATFGQIIWDGLAMGSVDVRTTNALAELFA